MCRLILPLVIGVKPKNKDAFEIYKNDFIQMDKTKDFYFPKNNFNTSKLEDYNDIISKEYMNYEFYMLNPDSILPKFNLFLLECINIFQTLDNNKHLIRNFECAFYGDGFYDEDELEELEEIKNKLLTTQFSKPSDLLIINDYEEKYDAFDLRFLTSYDDSLMLLTNSKGSILPSDVFEYVKIQYFIQDKEMNIPTTIAVMDILNYTTDKLLDKYWFAKYLSVG